MSATVLDLINQRRTIRNYDPDYQIPQEQLDQIINSARIAPTAKNLQDIDFFVLRNKEKLAEIEKILFECFDENRKKMYEARRQQYGIKNVVTCDAPVIILCCKNERQSDKFCEVDAGIAAMAIILAAQHYGIESMCLGNLRFSPKVEELLGLKKDSLIFGVAIGKIKGEPIVKEKKLINKVNYVD